MRSKKSRPGDSASVPSSPSPADLDSTAEREAPAGESGSEGIVESVSRGAPPSNTAPHNSKNTVPDGFRVLRLAVDSLYLSYPGDLTKPVLAALVKLKAYAQSEHSEEQLKAQYPLGSHIFEVKDRGAGRFPFVLVDNTFRIQLSKPSKTLPMAYVQVSAEYLAHKGPEAIEKELCGLLSELGELSGSNRVSRIDLAVDFSTPVLMDSWHRSAWVTRAMEIHSYAKDQRFTGWTIGMGGVMGCRLYDKVQEIVNTGKSWVMNQWIPMGWRPGESVWRLEFEFKRDFLKDRKLASLESILANLNGLWSYATCEWLRLTVPNEDDSTRARWPTHHLWVALASVDWQSEHGVLLDKCTTVRNPTELRFITVLLGLLSSYMAMHKIDDPNRAIDELVHKLYEHYSFIAKRDGLTFDEFLNRRIALKAREFNTAINAPGLVDNLKQDFEDAQADAYRKASQGE